MTCPTCVRSLFSKSLSRRYGSYFRQLSTSTRPRTSSLSSSNQSSHSPLATLIFFGTPVIVTFSLGVWQIKRLYKKHELIHDRHHRIHQKPLTASDLNALGDFEFRTVQLRGKFLHDLEMQVSPRSAPKNIPPAVLQWGGSSGLQVIKPCRLDDGRIVFVNCGWIPHRLINQKRRNNASVSPLPFLNKQPATMTFDQWNDTSQAVEFIGVIRNEQERNRFMPQNNPEKNEWFYFDGQQMAKYCGFQGSDSAPVIVELCEPVPPNGWPFPRSLDQFLEFRTPPSTHVTYAVTWFSLSAVLAILMRFRLKKVNHSK